MPAYYLKRVGGRLARLPRVRFSPARFSPAGAPLVAVVLRAMPPELSTHEPGEIRLRHGEAVPARCPLISLPPPLILPLNPILPLNITYPSLLLLVPTHAGPELSYTPTKLSRSFFAMSL